MNKDKNHIYTAQDFEDYWQGRMPAAKRYALELAALTDPFLNDALEGYQQNAENAGTSMAHLRKQLDEKYIAGTTALPGKKPAYIWWRIAALLLLLAGAGWGGYKFFQRDVNTEIAQNKVQETSQQTVGFDTLLDNGSSQTFDSAKNGITDEVSINKNVATLKKEQKSLPGSMKQEEITIQPSRDIVAKGEVRSVEIPQVSDESNAIKKETTVAGVTQEVVTQEKNAVAKTSTQPKQSALEMNKRKEASAPFFTILSEDKTIAPKAGWELYELSVRQKLIGNNLVKSGCEISALVFINEKGEVLKVEVKKTSCESIQSDKLIRILKEEGTWKVSKASTLELLIQL